LHSFAPLGCTADEKQPGLPLENPELEQAFALFRAAYSRDHIRRLASAWSSWAAFADHHGLDAEAPTDGRPDHRSHPISQGAAGTPDSPQRAHADTGRLSLPASDVPRTTGLYQGEAMTHRPLPIVRTAEGSAHSRRKPVDREKVLAEFKRLEERGILPPKKTMEQP